MSSYVFFLGHKSKGQTIKNFKDADYPNLLCLPFPDQNYSIPKQYLIFKGIGLTTYRNDKVSLQQMDFQQALVFTNHQHKLVLVDTKCVDIFETTSSTFNNSLIKCHDPMKKIELICNGCLRPILEMPFYKCVSYGDEDCNFTLHEWCTRLPSKVENHPGHPMHTLFLMPNAPSNLFNVFSCHVCGLLCNGYAYGCDRCEFYVDVTCGLMPENITHKSHPNHILRAKHVFEIRNCHMCIHFIVSELAFSCDICDFGSFHKIHGHPHCLSFAQGIESDGSCNICRKGLQYEMTLKCVKCEFAIHCECVKC
ncbi:hypothetical protein R6Q57_028365 [Mikania cordata]